MRMIRTLAVLCLAACAFASVPATALDEPIPIGFTEAVSVSVSADAFQAADIAIPSQFLARVNQAHAHRLVRVVTPDAPAVASLRTCLSGVIPVNRPVSVVSIADPPVPRLFV